MNQREVKIGFPIMERNSRMLRLYDKQINGKWLYSFTPFQYCRRNGIQIDKLDGYFCFKFLLPIFTDWLIFFYLKKNGTSKLICVFGKDSTMSCHFVVSLLKMQSHLALRCLLTFSRMSYNPPAANAEFTIIFYNYQINRQKQTKNQIH